jgi:hypothetical protein
MRLRRARTIAPKIACFSRAGVGIIGTFTRRPTCSNADAEQPRLDIAPLPNPRPACSASRSTTSYRPLEYCGQSSASPLRTSHSPTISLARQRLKHGAASIAELSTLRPRGEPEIAASRSGPSLRWVKLRRTQSEPMSSGLARQPTSLDAVGMSQRCHIQTDFSFPYCCESAASE